VNGKILVGAALAVVLVGAGVVYSVSADDKKTPARPQQQQQQKAVAKVKDPMCGMMVDPQTSPSSTYEGKTYYFCAREEKEEFDKNPQKYAKK
jgi:YHS domain-containing protein